MSYFWDKIQEVEISFRAELDAQRNQRLGLGSIDSAMRSVEYFIREFESLDSLARSERNAAAALGRIQTNVGAARKRIDNLLDARNNVRQRINDLQRKADQLEASIRKMEESIRYDYAKASAIPLSRKGANTEAYNRIKEKERKVQDMRNSLSDLSGKIMNMSM